MFIVADGIVLQVLTHTHTSDKICGIRVTAGIGQNAQAKMVLHSRHGRLTVRFRRAPRTRRLVLAVVHDEL